jgi:glycosyltransferase involved in cell wall biosynthesis
MDKRGNKRIGIFQAVHPLQMHTCNLVKKLLDHGYAVDVFLYDITSYYDISEIEADKTKLTINIYGHYLSAYSTEEIPPSRLKNFISFPHRCITFVHSFSSNFLKEVDIYGKIGSMLGADTKGRIFSQRIIKRTLEDMYRKEYVCLIGVEKMGLIWSGIISEKLKIPNLYYSLELYIEDHCYLQQSNKNKLIKKIEEIYHKKCHATIIQDQRRAEVLYTSNDVCYYRVKPIYLPVSNIGGCIRKKTNYCYDKWKLNPEDVIILYSGSISRSRWIDRVIMTSKRFPHQWKLLLHGVDWMETQTIIDQTGVSDRVILSTNLLPPSKMIELISSVTIGVVIYGNTNQNDILTGFSSEKLSLYLQCGIPIVAFNYPSYEHIKSYQCGVLIDSIDELPQAIKKILDNYIHYQKNAYKCFEEMYDYSKLSMNVLKYINSLS